MCEVFLGDEDADVGFLDGGNMFLRNFGYTQLRRRSAIFVTFVAAEFVVVDFCM
jgi:hypothetical protein